MVKMVYFGPPWNTWSGLIRTHPVGGGIPTGDWHWRIA